MTILTLGNESFHGEPVLKTFRSPMYNFWNKKVIILKNSRFSPNCYSLCVWMLILLFLLWNFSMTFWQLTFRCPYPSVTFFRWKIVFPPWLRLRSKQETAVLFLKRFFSILKVFFVWISFFFSTQKRLSFSHVIFFCCVTFLRLQKQTTHFISPPSTFMYIVFGSFLPIFIYFPLFLLF